MLRVSEDPSPFQSWLLNYRAVQRSIDEVSYHEGSKMLQSELPGFWNEIYTENLNRSIELCCLESGSFCYVYDDYDTMVAQGRDTDDGLTESRLVAAFGYSAPPTQLRKKDDRRLKGWLGPTEQRLGRDFDKGHFIAHSIGGAVDRAEFNVFAQLRPLNRGWSDAGKLYRQMENYCKEQVGAFCFSRPFYSDETSRPSWVEFGVLRTDGLLWVESFDNRSLGP